LVVFQGVVSVRIVHSGIISMDTTTPAPAALECPSVYTSWPFLTAAGLFGACVIVIIGVGIAFGNVIKDKANQMMAARGMGGGTPPAAPAPNYRPPATIWTPPPAPNYLPPSQDPPSEPASRGWGRWGRGGGGGGRNSKNEQYHSLLDNVRFNVRDDSL